eukprot:g1814.t1
MNVVQKLKVTKFGGSSCGSANAYRRLAEYFSNELKNGHRVVGVFSAMFAVTDRLLLALDAAVDGDVQTVKDARAAVWDLHVRTLDDLVKCPEARSARLQWMDKRMTEFFDVTVDRVMHAGKCSAHDKDLLSSLGERLSIGMMQSTCDEYGIPARLVESDSLLITDDVSGNATPLLDRTRENAQHDLVPLLNDGIVPLVSGFFGCSAETGKLTTLGRGGTDLTAAVLGHSLDADEINLYKVEYTKTEDGWLDSWQPGFVGVVHDCEIETTIPVISYGDAAQLAHFGKKVLHPSTVHPAVEKDIPIYVKSNWDPTLEGTLICSKADSNRPITTVTGVEIDKYDARHHTEPLVEVVVPQDNAASRVACQNVVSREQINETLSALQRLSDVGLRRMGLKDTLILQEKLTGLASQIGERVKTVQMEGENVDRANVSAVALVGSRIAEMPGIADAVVNALDKANIECIVPDRINDSRDNFTVFVWSSKRKEAMRLLHNEFVGRKIRRMDLLGANSFWMQQQGGNAKTNTRGVLKAAPHLEEENEGAKLGYGAGGGFTV